MNDSEWENLEELSDELSDDEDFTYPVNPLDNAQASLDLIDGNTSASPDNLNSPCVLRLSPPTSNSTCSVPSIVLKLSQQSLILLHSILHHL